jgi:hypothetical protein
LQAEQKNNFTYPNGDAYYGGWQVRGGVEGVKDVQPNCGVKGNVQPNCGVKGYVQPNCGELKGTFS